MAPTTPVALPQAPTTPQVQTPAKTSTTPPIDYNQGLGRETDIMKNLQDFQKQGMTPDQIKQAGSYATATPEKKAIMDSFIGSMNKPMTQQGMTDTMLAGGEVPQQTSSDFRNATFTANKMKTLNGMSPTQLMSELKNGNISTTIDQRLAGNANYQQAKALYEKEQKTNTMNQVMTTAIGGLKGQEIQQDASIEAISDQLIKKYGLEQGITNEQAYSQYVKSDPTLQTATTQLSGVNRQIADINQALTDGVKSMKAQY